MDRIEGGKIFRQAWIEGVKRHFPGKPKSGYITPWDEMSNWEQEAASNVFEQVCAFLVAGGNEKRLTPEQGGRLIRFAWIIQVYQHLPEPKPSYVLSWEKLPEWEQQVDIDLFQALQNLPKAASSQA